MGRNYVMLKLLSKITIMITIMTLVVSNLASANSVSLIETVGENAETEIELTASGLGDLKLSISGGNIVTGVDNPFPIADGYIDSSTPDTVISADDYTTVLSDGNLSGKSTYYKFDLTDIPDDRYIIGARLVVYQTDGADNQNVDVYVSTSGYFNDNWNENNLTYNYYRANVEDDFKYVDSFYSSAQSEYAIDTDIHMLKDQLINNPDYITYQIRSGVDENGDYPTQGVNFTTKESYAFQPMLRLYYAAPGNIEYIWKSFAHTLNIIPPFISDDITLPTSLQNGNCTITWSSNDTEYIQNNGTVTRPGVNEDNKEISLTATFRSGVYTASYTFNTIVLSEDYESVEGLLNPIYINDNFADSNMSKWTATSDGGKAIETDATGNYIAFNPNNQNNHRVISEYVYSTGTLYCEYDVKFGDGVASISFGGNVNLENTTISPAAGLRKDGNYIQYYSDGQFCNLRSLTNAKVVITDLDKWYTIKMVMNIPNNTYSVYLIDRADRSIVGQAENVEFYNYYQYIDDVTIISSRKICFDNILIGDLDVALSKITGIPYVEIPANIDNNYEYIMKTVDGINAGAVLDDIKWSLEAGVEGVTINSKSGVLSVSSTAKPGPVLVYGVKNFLPMINTTYVVDVEK